MLVPVDNIYPQEHRGRTGTREVRDRNVRRLICGECYGGRHQRKVGTLACTDYSPEDSHNWEGHVGTNALHEQVHGKFHEHIWDAFGNQSKRAGECGDSY
jgi:hypothetical protein